MTNIDKPFIIDVGLISGAGRGKIESLEYLTSGSRSSLKTVDSSQGIFTIGTCPEPDKTGVERLEQLLGIACGQIVDTVERLRGQYGSHRIAVIVGSTDNGSALSFMAVKHHDTHGVFPPGYSLDLQLPHRAGQIVKDYFKLTGPMAGISTACTSGSSALITGMRLLSAGLCDAVIAGGADIVSASVLYGFAALEAVDRKLCKPFSANRSGINLGEGAALLVLTREQSGPESIRLVGTGETSDAHHMTAPEASGAEASRAMEDALAMAGLESKDIDYINLHGTGTLLNDAMESRATHRVFGPTIAASSTKSLIGHTLGAAGALEASFCWLTLSSLNTGGALPQQAPIEEIDPDVSPLNFVSCSSAKKNITTCMSNNFAFGGSNTSLILRKMP